MIINYCETIYLCQIALIKGIVSKLHKSSVRYIRQFSWPLMSFVSVKICETNQGVVSVFSIPEPLISSKMGFTFTWRSGGGDFPLTWKGGSVEWELLLLKVCAFRCVYNVYIVSSLLL